MIHRFALGMLLWGLLVTDGAWAKPAPAAHRASVEPVRRVIAEARPAKLPSGWIVNTGVRAR